MSDVAALLIEREGYKRRGLKDRAAQVDAALARLGHRPPAPVVEAPSTTPVETAVAAKPRRK